MERLCGPGGLEADLQEMCFTNIEQEAECVVLSSAGSWAEPSVTPPKRELPAGPRVDLTSL